MNQVSQFCIQQNSERSILKNKNSLTPGTKQSKQQQSNQASNSIVINSNLTKSNYKCNQCPQYLSTITSIKKKQIVLQYEVQKLKEEISKLKRQKQYLISIQYKQNLENVSKYNPIMYYKQDLQSQLYESKYLLQLLLLSQGSKQNGYNGPNNMPQNNILKPSVKMESKKQKQALNKVLCQPMDLKKKCEDLLLQNVRLQERNMIKDKIIQQRSLFPLYHYDQRILTLRKNVQFWYRKSQQESIKLTQMIEDMKKMHKQVKKQAKLMIQQQRLYWEKQILLLKNKMINSSINGSLQTPIQLSDQTNNYNNSNILLQNDQSIIYEQNKKRNKKQKKAESSIVLSKSPIQSQILCKQCMDSTINKHQIKSQNRPKTSSKFKIKDYQNTESTKRSNKNQLKTQNKNRSSTAVRHVIKRQDGQQNMSMISKNFAKIQIKCNNIKKEKNINKINQIKQKINQKKLKCNEQINKKQTYLKLIPCQRCANKIM